MWRIRLLSLVIKEFLAVLRDPKSRVILIVPPLVQLVVFSFAATLDVRNADVMILNRDSGAWSQELIHQIDGSPMFSRILYAQTPAAVRRAIDQQDVVAAVEIGATFSRDIEAGRPASAQVILDGRRSNTAQIVFGYLNQIVANISATTPRGRKTESAAVGVVARNWFNPNLLSQWVMVPSLVAVIALLTGIIVTALSIAREREMGTFDQLMVSPLRTHEILIGKLVPPIIIGLLQITLFIVVARFVFGVPFTGSLVALYLSAVVYLAAVVGLGLFISAMSMTQQQAILGAFLLMVPVILLSGFATPIDNMPVWLRPVTLLDPLRYFLVVAKGSFLRNLPLTEVVANTVPLAAIAVVTLSGAAWLFRRRLE
jgi:ABC-2 type transport system permease protein